MNPIGTLITRARLHRFGDHVALSMGVKEGYESTVYITPEVAEALGNLLLAYAWDCQERPFTVSRLGTQVAEADGTVKKE